VGLRKQVPLIDYAIEMLRLPSTIHPCIPLPVHTNSRSRTVVNLQTFPDLRNFKLKSETIQFFKCAQKRFPFGNEGAKREGDGRILLGDNTL
jgi:hypothetical protein